MGLAIAKLCVCGRSVCSRRRTNTLTLNTRNIPRDHRHHHGHVHGREELTPRAVLTFLPMLSSHNPPSVSIPVSADIAEPSWSVPNPVLNRPVATALGNAGPSNAPTAAHAPTPTFAARIPHRHHHHRHHRTEEPALSAKKTSCYFSNFLHILSNILTSVKHSTSPGSASIPQQQFHKLKIRLGAQTSLIAGGSSV